VQPDLTRRALVFGGTGAVGSEVVRGLAAATIPTTFVYHDSADQARLLHLDTGARALRADLSRPAEVRAVCREAGAITHFVPCAATSRPAARAEIDDDAWDRVQAVNIRSAFVASRELLTGMAARGGGHVVLVGALDRAQSLPLPAHFAASQGALAALAMALAKEHGGAGIHVNLVALGLLDAGLSRAIAPELLADYNTFSALRRPGTPREAARAILWLALENTYMNGKTVSVNGGI
jgi:NAD(P)-dependent dehydrogenase (short-subunit alcohol dehydrogenase family)